MRDHRKLRAFRVADDFVVALYQATKFWPLEERYGLTSQIRRAAVSISSNLVEGCARSSQREFFRFIEISFSSAREVTYQLSLAKRLEMPVDEKLERDADDCCRILSGLLKSMDPE